MFITHDLGVIAEIADDVAVMYAGQVIERTDVNTLFDRALHPYTKGLMASIPHSGQGRDKALPTIGGTVPSLKNLPQGCRFYGRCVYRQGRCVNDNPKLELVALGHEVACHFARDIAEGLISAQSIVEGDL